jgi:hypothetical protein
MSASVIIRPTKRPRLRGSGSRFQTGLGHISISGMPKRKLENGEGSAQRSSSNGRTNPNSTSSSHTYVFLASRAGFRDPVALAFVWRMPDARSVRASATRGGRESAQCLVPVHHSTRQYPCPRKNRLQYARARASSSSASAAARACPNTFPASDCANIRASTSI